MIILFLPNTCFAKKERTIGETFSGEEIHYEIDFAFLKSVAEVTLKFSPLGGEGKYLITLKGSTKNLLGLPILKREDLYVAICKEIDGGRKLATLTFEEKVTIGKSKREKYFEIDHANGLLKERVFKEGILRREIIREIPKGREMNDFLTASFNFRYGVYGVIQPGRTYMIPVIPRKGVDFYEVRVESSEEDRSLVPYFVRIKVDPEILNSKTGLIEGYLSKELYPVKGRIPDVILFGDVQGRLKRIVKSENQRGNHVRN